MIREEIIEGVFFTTFKNDYKRQRTSIQIKMPLEREYLTEMALLPFLLERGCEQYPDMTEIKRRLNMLYGASLYTSASSIDYFRVLSVAVDGIDEKYFNEDEHIAAARTDILMEILFHPVIKDEAFLDEWVDIEREKLRNIILSEINDKRAYCLMKAGEIFFGKKDTRSLPGNGFEADLDKIDGKRLYTVYKKMMSECTVEIVSIGGISEDIKRVVSDHFSSINRNPVKISDMKAMPYTEERSETYSFPVEQDKYAMIFTAGRVLTPREQTVFRVANTILGSSPTSRFFMNVREKESLCYYCSSRPGFMSGSLTVDSGVEYENIEKLKTAIGRELVDITSGNISDRELSEAKLMLKNALSSVGDSIDGLTGWYFNSIYRLGNYLSPEEEINNISSVTKAEIADLIGLFKLNTSVVITGRQI